MDTRGENAPDGPSRPPPDLIRRLAEYADEMESALDAARGMS
jgi:hypothetical protein